GPAGDRFYGFDKKTGELVWRSSPGDRPRDNSFSHPYLGWLDGKRVFYAAIGDGSVVCVNARTGDPIWRVPLFRAGINATVCVHNGKILWRHKIGSKQLNACPFYADGKLYVPMLSENPGRTAEGGEAAANGTFYIIKPTDQEAQELAHVALEGRCFGSPSAY